MMQTWFWTSLPRKYQTWDPSSGTQMRRDFPAKAANAEDMLETNIPLRHIVSIQQFTWGICIRMLISLSDPIGCTQNCAFSPEIAQCLLHHFTHNVRMIEQTFKAISREHTHWFTIRSMNLSTSSPQIDIAGVLLALDNPTLIFLGSGMKHDGYLTNSGEAE